MTNCNFSERPARDEEPVSRTSSLDPTRTETGDVRSELYEAQAAQGRYFVHDLTSEASLKMKCMGRSWPCQDESKCGGLSRVCER